MAAFAQGLKWHPIDPASDAFNGGSSVPICTTVFWRTNNLKPPLESPDEFWRGIGLINSFDR